MTGRRDGFALIVVVFLLFAVGVSAAATFQIARSEALLSGLSSDVHAAQAIAQAGLMRYIGEAPLTEELGAKEFVIEYPGANGFSPDGVAQVSARKVRTVSSTEDLYRITSVGRVTNRRFFDTPTVREASIFATRSTGSLMSGVGGLVTTAGSVTIGNRFTVNGTDEYTGGTAGCPARANRAGSAARGNSSSTGSGSLSGSPANSNLGSTAAVLSALGLPPWAALTDPNLFPVDYDIPTDAWPNALAMSGFPTIRYDGNLTADQSRSGKGLLIVTGTLTIGNLFTWDGVILAGSMNNVSGIYGTTITGMLVAGLSTAPASLSLTGNTGILGALLGYPSIRYHSCNVYRANRSIGVLNIEPLSWWSGY